MQERSEHFFFECTDCSKCSFLSTCCGPEAQICAKLCIDGASDILACEIFLLYLTMSILYVFIYSNGRYPGWQQKFQKLVQDGSTSSLLSSYLKCLFLNTILNIYKKRILTFCLF